MSQLRVVRPPQRQLTLDELTFVPRSPVLRLVDEADGWSISLIPGQVVEVLR